MAAHSNRFPSPISSRPTNPNPRNSEVNSSIRRSFSGSGHAKPSLLANPRRLDPTTPANSPSDSARRRSVGIDYEEKENDDKDSVLKASKLQSPAKGCKHFMAPTISAASKFNPSPRKKVLVERNDPVRTSISLSDGKAMFFSDMPNVSDETSSDSSLVESEKKKAAPKPSKKVTFLDVPSDSQHSTESVVTDSDCLKLESSSTPLLDGDPSLPPYDPKTNYLSPRPQFIRYKPNPRVVMLLNKEKWLEPDDSLMGDIMSGSFSDSDDSQNQGMESADVVIGLDEEIEIEAESSISEPLPVSITPADEISDMGYVQDRNEKKQRSISRLMCLSVVLTLLVAACVSISVTRSDSFDEFLAQDLGLSDMSSLYQQSREAVASARLSLGRLAGHVNHVSANSVSMVFKLVNELGKGEKWSPTRFMNLSDLQEITLNKPNFHHIVENPEEDEFEEEMVVEMVEEERYADEEILDTESDALEEEETYVVHELESENLQDIRDEAELNSADQSAAVVVELESEYLQDLHNQPELSSADQSAAEVVELESEYLQDIQNQEELNSAVVVELEKLEIEKATEMNLDILMQESSTPVGESFFAGYAIGVSSLCACLVAVLAAFIYHNKKPHHQPISSNVEQVLRKEMDNELSNAHEEEFSQTASEMSGSFQKSESYSMREVQSSERKARKYSRRESLASSSRFSIESPSYGSFTTYEKVPIKSSGNGGEEIVTPVRRSSRIRNHQQQVTSP